MHHSLTEVLAMKLHDHRVVECSPRSILAASTICSNVNDFCTSLGSNIIDPGDNTHRCNGFSLSSFASVFFVSSVLLNCDFFFFLAAVSFPKMCLSTRTCPRLKIIKKYLFSTLSPSDAIASPK